MYDDSRGDVVARQRQPPTWLRSEQTISRIVVSGSGLSGASQWVMWQGIGEDRLQRD
jgi:hypothetical protein